MRTTTWSAGEKPKQPGVNAPEIPRVPPPRPETPGKVKPGREMPDLPSPEPEQPGVKEPTPESPASPRTPAS